MPDGEGRRWEVLGVRLDCICPDLGELAFPSSGWGLRAGRAGRHGPMAEAGRVDRTTEGKKWPDEVLSMADLYTPAGSGRLQVRLLVSKAQTLPSKWEHLHPTGLLSNHHHQPAQKPG